MHFGSFLVFSTRALAIHDPDIFMSLASGEPHFYFSVSSACRPALTLHLIKASQNLPVRQFPQASSAGFPWEAGARRRLTALPAGMRRLEAIATGRS